MTSKSSAMADDIHAENSLWGPIPAGFDVVRLVATGRQSEVWEVCRKEDGRRLAWKRMPSQCGLSMERGMMFAAEATVLHSVQSPYVVRIAEDLTGGRPRSFLLEWLDGETLNERIDREKWLPLSQAFWYGRQIAEGLRAVWNAGYAHGDVKPGNVFLCRDGSVKLIDFGFARLIGDRHPPKRPRLLKGTAEYMAPELLAGMPENPVAADVYGLGVTLFVLLAGRPPFTGESVSEILRLHRQAKPPSLKRLRPEIPVAARLLIERMLSKQPLRRPRSSTAIIRELMDLELKTMTARVAA